MSSNTVDTHNQDQLILKDEELKILRNLMVFILNEHQCLNIFDDVWDFIDKKEFGLILNKIKEYIDKK
jgi:hypothetical protein